tara:strand:- start:2037 stop:3758 length:1722 start_codon:yes stop_codon:yes gene_type:complete
MQSSFDYDLVIQGAGSSGCVTALLAHRCGLNVAIIDKSSKGTFRGNAHYLNAYSLELLSQCGLDMDRLARLATPETYAFCMAYGLSLNHIVHTLNLLDDPSIQSQYQSIGRFGAALNVPFSLIHQDLVALIEKQHIPILWESEITTIDEGNHSVIVTTSNEKATREITAHYLIGADGAQSGIRELCFLPPKINTHDFFINVEIMSDLSSMITDPAMLTWIINPSFPSCFVMHQINGHQNIQIPVFIEKNLSYANDSQWVKRYIAETLGVKNAEYTLIRSQPWVVTTHCMETMRKDWIFLLGDSSHTLTPAGGLGLNTALGDVANLIWKLSVSLNENSNKKILDSYQLERAPVNRDAVNQSLKNFNDFKSIAKSFFLPPSLSVPWKKTLSYCMPASKHAIETILSAGYQYSMNGLLQIKPFKRQFARKLEHRLERTRQHFNGIGSHLGYRIDSDWIINSNRSSNFSIGDYVPSLDSGSLWLSNEIRIIQSNNSLLEVFQYGHWVALLFHEDHTLEAMLNEKKNLRSFLQHRDFTVQDNLDITQSCVLIRPDFFIAYVGDTTLNDEVLDLLAQVN